MLPNMRNVAAVIAKDARENLAVISVGPLFARWRRAERSTASL
jgi:hypothetical protein